MSDQLIGWTKLNHKCFACGKGYSDIQFEFKCTEPWPSTRVESYHWNCTPQALKVYQSESERAMWSAAQQPL